MKRGIYKNKGDIVIVEEYKDTIAGPRIPNTDTWIRVSEIQTYELLNSVYLKFVVCPVCNKKIWLNIPSEHKLVSIGIGKLIKTKTIEEFGSRQYG